MKKIILILSALLCFNFLSAEGMPEWVSAVMAANKRQVAKLLNISLDSNRIFMKQVSQSVQENYDVKKKAQIDSFIEFESSFNMRNSSFIYGDEKSLEPSYMIRNPSGYTTITHKIDASTYIERKFKTLSGELKYMDLKEDTVKVYGENFDKILEHLKSNNLINDLKVEAEYYVYQKIDNKKSKKMNRNVVVASGEKPVENPPEYTELGYYCVYSIPEDKIGEFIKNISVMPM